MPLIKEKLTTAERRALRTLQKQRDYHRLIAADFFEVYGDHTQPTAAEVAEATELLGLTAAE